MCTHQFFFQIQYVILESNIAITEARKKKSRMRMVDVVEVKCVGVIDTKVHKHNNNTTHSACRKMEWKTGTNILEDAIYETNKKKRK